MLLTIKVNKELSLRFHIRSIYNFEFFKYFYIIIVSKEFNVDSWLLLI